MPVASRSVTPQRIEALDGVEKHELINFRVLLLGMQQKDDTAPLQKVVVIPHARFFCSGRQKYVRLVCKVWPQAERWRDMSLTDKLTRVTSSENHGYPQHLQVFDTVPLPRRLCFHRCPFVCLFVFLSAGLHKHY